MWVIYCKVYKPFSVLWIIQGRCPSYMTVPRRWDLLIWWECFVRRLFWPVETLHLSKARPGTALNDAVMDDNWLWLVGTKLRFHAPSLVLCREFRLMNKPGIQPDISLNAVVSSSWQICCHSEEIILSRWMTLGVICSPVTKQWLIYPSLTNKKDGDWDRWESLLWNHVPFLQYKFNRPANASLK